MTQHVGFPDRANDWRLGVVYVGTRLTINLAQGNTSRSSILGISVVRQCRQSNQQSDNHSTSQDLVQNQYSSYRGLIDSEMLYRGTTESVRNQYRYACTESVSTSSQYEYSTVPVPVLHGTVQVQLYRYSCTSYMIDDDLSKIPFLHTVYVPVYVLLVLVLVHIRYSITDCMIPVLQV